MPAGIPREVIEYILFGTGDSRRLVQDSPILVDVWAKYAHEPWWSADLLITSHKDTTANKLAAAIYKRLRRPPVEPGMDPKADGAEVAPMQGFVAARLYFGEVLTILVPLTPWWRAKKTQDELELYKSPTSKRLKQTVDEVVRLTRAWPPSTADAEAANNRSALGRFLGLCALITHAGFAGQRAFHDVNFTAADTADLIRAADTSTITTELLGLLQAMEVGSESMVERISLNRTAAGAIAQSVPTVKADAARRLFDMDFSGINWAVLDSGIDAGHPAFGRRVKSTYDFTNYRQIVNLANDTKALRDANLESLKTVRQNAKLPRTAGTKLKKIAEVLNDGRPVPWDLVSELVQIESPAPPTNPHGTHVAGIIGANKTDHEDSADGMCPGIGLYDFRILTPRSTDDTETASQQNTEFAIIAALQFIRYLNEQAGYLLIAGVNLSLQIAHDVKSFACGRTPICIECERLIDSGVVVVAAAGNVGEEKKLLLDQTFIDYQPYSIADPGNAERVITVGATHRLEPFNYGISYFSCRGPTGDGRLKPDLVAPGERITAPLPRADEEEQWGAMDGTSMAAPHVSGAAAMLMARYPELIGKPDRIKRILCETATDLGRQRTFQGHGLLDILRALQSQ
jgi:subtilisin family serine protease